MRNFKHFFRSVKKRKTISTITIGGYALSMAVLLILVSFIIGEKNRNSNFENKRNIYRIVRSDNESIVPRKLHDEVMAKIPGVDKMSPYVISEKYFKNRETKEPVKIIATNDDFLDMFSFHFILSSPDPTLSAKNNIILTEDFSKKLFGDKNPLGEILEINDGNYTISGVVTNVPQNASFRFDALINANNSFLINTNSYNESLFLLNAFVMLNRESDISAVEAQISKIFNQWQTFKNVTLSLQPLKEVYFKGLPNDEMEHANINLIYLLIGIALVILFMTIFNYMSLSVSSGYEKLTELGIRKTSGAGRKDIFMHILSESLMESLVSMILAYLLSFAIAPLFSELLGAKIEIANLLLHPFVIVAGFLLFLLTGILSGLYPALQFSNVSPVKIISGRKGIQQKYWQGGVVTFQFLISIVLIISMLVIQKQLDFVKHSDMGFDKDLMVRLDLNGNSVQKWNVLKNELLKNPEIISVSASEGGPIKKGVTVNRHFNVNGKEKDLQIDMLFADEDFIETFGLEIIKGSNFQSSDSLAGNLVNEHLYRELEYGDNDIGTTSLKNTIGVVKDFHYENLYTKIGNLMIRPLKDMSPEVLNIKIQGNIAENLAFIKKVYSTIEPEMPFSFLFYDDWIQSMYQKEEKQAHAINLFTILAIIISCLGLIGLIQQSTQTKIKEIGIRKINGATTGEIIALLNQNLVKWVVIAFIIATPVAYYTMNKWLENFAYKTELSWWIFALAGLLALGIALLTVSFQSWKAASRNPVEALRYE